MLKLKLNTTCQRAMAIAVLTLSSLGSLRAATPDDSLYASKQWWLGAYDPIGSAGVANFPKAWDLGKGSPVSGPTPVIAVLDSGVRDHPDLRANLILPGYNFISKPEYANNGGVGRNNDPTDTGDALSQAEKDANVALWDGCPTQAANSWHGNLVAGQLGAVTHNAKGVAGINWRAQILPVRVSGKCGAAVQDMVDGMRWAAGLPVSGAPLNTHPAKIVVIGFAGAASCDLADPNPDIARAAKLYLDAIAELRAKTVLVVAAAGNTRGAVGRPANCAGVLAVTAVNRQGFKATYANIGAQVALAATGGDANYKRTCDDLAGIPDEGIFSTSGPGSPPSPTGEDYAAGTGTSFAAPQVAGVASLMWAANPALTLAQVETGLKLSARPHVAAAALGACSSSNASRCSCSTSSCGSGLLDAEEAMRYAAIPASYAPPSRTPVSLSGAALEQCGIKQGSTPIEPTPTPNPTPTPTPTPTPSPSSGGGGGAAAPFWVLGVALAAALLRRRDDGSFDAAQKGE